MWATIRSMFFFFWLYTTCPSLATHNAISLISVFTIWWYPCVEFLCCWKKVMLSRMCSLGKLSTFVLLHFVLQVCTCLLLQVSLAFLSLHSNPLWWKEKFFFFGVSFGNQVGLQRTGQLQFLQHQWSGHIFGLLWCWMVCLGNKPS